MTTNKDSVKQIIQYALLVAGEEDERQSRKLGPIHLIKYVYLADLIYAERNNGNSYTGIKWQFYHYGPWAEDAYTLIEPALNEIHADNESFESKFDSEKDCIRWSKRDENLLNLKQQQLPIYITSHIKNMVHKFTNNTSALLDYVYKTYPMLNAAPNELLDFTHDNFKPIEATTEANENSELTKKKKKALKAALREIREKFHKTERQNLVPPITPPRYDEVYQAGIEYLDSLAGENFKEESLNVKFSPDIWKSSTRNNNDLS